MNRTLSILCSLSLLFFLGIGCSDDPENNTASDPIDNPMPNEDDVPFIIPNGDEKYLLEDSEYIFDQNKLLRFDLVLPQQHLNQINQDPAAEEYVEGSLVFEGDTISPVGIRYKGSIGAFVGCLSGNTWTNPSGSKTCTKLSMKVKINWGNREEKFFGLKKVQFHSMNNDPSQMHERLGYHLFRSMGVPAPRAVHAKLYINGQYNGLFALIEHIDGRFTRYNFEDGEGNLYKEVWPITDKSTLHADDRYLAGLKTNEDENPSLDLIKTFAQEIVDAESQTALHTTLESFLNIDQMLSYSVVDRLIRHDDGPFHWYCNFGDCESHNFYWYEEPENQKLHLIAWDLDLAFQNIQDDSNPVTPIPDDWGETTNNCNPFPYGAFALMQKSAACDKLTGGLADYESEYQNLRSEFIATRFSKAEIDNLLDTWKSQIEEATLDARNIHDDAVSFGQWESALNTLRNKIDWAREN